MATDFQEKVWSLCSKIPKGKLSTYSQIAHKLNTKAYRAVGIALKQNPFAPVVPCHRVVNSDGRPGGYMGKNNNPKKIYLLKKEGIKFSKGKVVDFKKKIFSL